MSEKQTAAEFFKNSSHNSDRNCILKKQSALSIDIYNNKRKNYSQNFVRKADGSRILQEFQS